MIDARFQPLKKWPRGEMRPAARQRQATFRSTYQQTLDLLEDELNRLGAREIVIQAGFKLSQIRNDGWPYSNASPDHPAVVVSFLMRKGKPVMMPCDTYTTFDDNLRAIALTLEALRAINRYGVTEHEEQYTGFTPLPAPGGGELTREAAEQIVVELARTSIAVLRDPAGRDAVIREAKRNAHPDRVGGSHDKFIQLTRALQVLGL